MRLCLEVRAGPSGKLFVHGNWNIRLRFAVILVVFVLQLGFDSIDLISFIFLFIFSSFQSESELLAEWLYVSVLPSECRFRNRIFKVVAVSKWMLGALSRS